MLPSQYFILFINIFSSVTVQSHKTTDKIRNLVKEHDSRVGPSAVPLSENMENFDEGDERIMYDYATNYQNNADDPYGVLKFTQEDKEDGNRDDREVSSERETNRAFQTGDIFTPTDLLPICSKLLAKVRVGEGRGIVSSSKSPEALADKLFTGFFLTTRRIVYLTDKDLPALDALQALALEGEDVNIRTSGDSITERPYQILNYRGQHIGLDAAPRRCHYKLINKKVNASDAALRKGSPTFNKVLKMERLLNPKRQLIVNYNKSRKSNNRTVTFKKGVAAKNNTGKQDNAKTVAKKGRRHRIRVNRRKLSKDGKRKVSKHKVSGRQRLQNKGDNAQPITTTKRPSSCKWRYICRDPQDLDTCRLHSSCRSDGHNKRMIDNNRFVDPKARMDHEQNQLVMHFRKMLGITVMDEEVEKILEKHVLITSPANMRPDQKIETIDEYFNNIIMAQNAQSTTPYSSNEETHTPPPHPMAADVSDLNETDSEKGLRKSVDGKAKDKSTLRAYVRETQVTSLFSKSTVPNG